MLNHGKFTAISAADARAMSIMVSAQIINVEIAIARDHIIDVDSCAMRGIYVAIPVGVVWLNTVESCVKIVAQIRHQVNDEPGRAAKQYSAKKNRLIAGELARNPDVDAYLRAVFCA